MATPEENRAQYDADFAAAQAKFETTVADLNTQHSAAEEVLTADLEAAQTKFVTAQAVIDPALVPAPVVEVPAAPVAEEIASTELSPIVDEVAAPSAATPAVVDDEGNLVALVGVSDVIPAVDAPAAALIADAGTQTDGGQIETPALADGSAETPQA